MILDGFNITPEQCIGTGPIISTMWQRVKRDLANRMRSYLYYKGKSCVK